MAWYNAGTVAVTNNSTAVVGTGTAFNDYVDAGQGFRGPDGLIYEIASVVSATALTLATAYKGATASGQAYSINPAQGYLRDLALQAASLVLSFATVRDGIGQGKFPDGTVGTPGIRFASDEDTGFYRPGANLLSVVTSGTERVRVENAYALRILGAASGEGILSFDAGTLGLSVRDAQIRGGNNGLNQTYLDFYTSDADVPTRRMRIDRSGNVGIGLTSMSGRLDISQNSRIRWDLSTTTVQEIVTNIAANAYLAKQSDALSHRFLCSSAEAMRINSSSNVGIGGDPGGTRLYVYNSAASDVTTIQSGTTSCGLLMGDSVGTARIGTRSGNIIFDVGIERMRISGSGVGIGTASLAAAAPLDVSTSAGRVFISASGSNNSLQSVNSTNNAYVNLHIPNGVLMNQSATGIQNSNSIDLNAPGATQTINHSGTASGWGYLLFGYNGSQIGSITQNGTTGVAFNTSSDYRLKEDIQPIDDPVELLLALKPCNFAWKSTGERINGFIAHELQEVIPEAVTGEKDAEIEREIEISPAIPASYDEDGEILTEAVDAVTEMQTVPVYQGIDQSKLVPVLTAALQAAFARLDAQTATIASLAARLAALEGTA